jgi:hypothetical protein
MPLRPARVARRGVMHRQQGATSDRTHYLAEGGGRELAYVALSRARQASIVHAVADSPTASTRPSSTSPTTGPSTAINNGSPARPNRALTAPCGSCPQIPTPSGHGC